MILRTLTALAAPAGSGARLSVFYFHRVLERPDPLLPGEPDAAMFDRILGWIGKQFRVLDPLEACERLGAGTLPARPAVISFDDGYLDNHDVALPLLKRHGMQAAFFVATGFLEGGMMFNDRVIEAIRRAGPDPIRLAWMPESSASGLAVGTDRERRAAIGHILKAIKHLAPDVRLQRVLELEASVRATPKPGTMMRPEHVRALHDAGMRVGGHTRTHPILCAAADDEAAREISGGLQDLAQIIGHAPLLFAYPNGKPGADYDARHVAMVRQTGCLFAFSTRAGAANAGTPKLEIPRFTPWDRTRVRFAARALQNLATARRAP